MTTRQAGTHTQTSGKRGNAVPRSTPVRLAYINDSFKDQFEAYSYRAARSELWAARQHHQTSGRSGNANAQRVGLGGARGTIALER